MAKSLQSKRLEGIGEYYFSQKLRQIEQMNSDGLNVLNLGIGSPDMKPPKVVEDALIAALQETGAHQYQSYKGLPELRTAFSEWYQTYFGVTLDSESEVMPLIGSKEGVMHISMALLNEGDQVLVPNPGYPTYDAATRLAGGKTIPYSLNEKNLYLPDLTEISRQDLTRIKLMWINYPHMPTGADGNEQLFRELTEFSRKHQIVIVNDNPYGFILTSDQHSLLKHRHKNDLILELNSLSKSHNMAGWRVGVLAGNADLIQSVLKFKSNMDSGQFKPIMKAAVAALGVDKTWYEELNIVYQKRRKLVFEIAEMLKCSYQKDQVGMFVWAKIPEGQTDGKAFADHLLEKYRIFVPPGSVFGSGGQQYVRFSLCSDLPVWNKVINRIKTST